MEGLPAREVSLTSSRFGFVENGRVNSRSSSRVMFKFSVPFAIGRWRRLDAATNETLWGRAVLPRDRR